MKVGVLEQDKVIRQEITGEVMAKKESNLLLLQNSY